LNLIKLIKGQKRKLHWRNSLKMPLPKAIF
jgi:hypothetical protein